MNDLYIAWNGAIGEWFFGYAQAGRAAYLAVDDDELSELGVDWGLDASDPAKDLARAVQAEYKREESVDVFRRAIAPWRKGGSVGEPPYLGFLALCVLAASRMASDPSAGIAKHAYYPRLNQLLGREGHVGSPPGFDRAGHLWRELNSWLEDDCHGARGLATARTHHFFRHIGWPLSQCLLRAADRHRLPDFFRTAGLEPGTEIERPQLWVLFRHWAHPGCGLTEQGLHSVANATEYVAEQIAEIVKRELDTWDGDLRDSFGRRRGEIVLMLEKWAGGRRAELRLVARRPKGFPEGEFRLSDGRTMSLPALNDDWYRPLDLPVTESLLVGGVTLSTEGFALAYDTALAVPFRACLEPFSAWLSHRQATAVEEHAVLVHSAALHDARDFLSRYAKPGWRELKQPAGNVPSGWTVIECVHVTAAPSGAPPHVTRLAPRLFTAMSLEGGLPLDTGIYLSKGEPDLWVTVEQGEQCHVEVDGTVRELGGGVIELPLANLRLPAGDHEIRAAGVRRRFSTVEGFGLVASRGTASLGHVLSRHSGYRPAAEIAAELPSGHPPRGSIHLCGAAPLADPSDLPLPDAPRMLLPYGFDEYVVLGSQVGECITPVPPERPSWLQQLAIDTCQFFDLPLAFAPQWLVLKGRLGVLVHWRGVERVTPQPAPERSHRAFEQAWGRHILGAAACDPLIDEADQPLWDRYVSAARELEFQGATT